MHQVLGFVMLIDTYAIVTSLLRQVGALEAQLALYRSTICLAESRALCISPLWALCCGVVPTSIAWLQQAFNFV